MERGQKRNGKSHFGSRFNNTTDMNYELIRKLKIEKFLETTVQRVNLKTLCAVFCSNHYILINLFTFLSTIIY